LANIRERLEFVTKEYYTFKNEVTPSQKTHDNQIKMLQLELQGA